MKSSDNNNGERGRLCQRQLGLAKSKGLNFNIDFFVNCRLIAPMHELCAIIYLTMGYKVVCLNCRKAFNTSSDYHAHVPTKCPECSGQLVMFNHKFRPPKQSDVKAWKVVTFLYEHGFNYQHVQKDIPYELLKNMPESDQYVEYPENMTDAKDFVEKYKTQARKLN